MADPDLIEKSYEMFEIQAQEIIKRAKELGMNYAASPPGKPENYKGDKVWFTKHGHSFNHPSISLDDPQALDFIIASLQAGVSYDHIGTLEDFYHHQRKNSQILYKKPSSYSVFFLR
jgi:hypothetical protein